MADTLAEFAVPVSVLECMRPVGVRPLAMFLDALMEQELCEGKGPIGSRGGRELSFVFD
jgi:hypothetical protein